MQECKRKYICKYMIVQWALAIELEKTDLQVPEWGTTITIEIKMFRFSYLTG